MQTINLNLLQKVYYVAEDVVIEGTIDSIRAEKSSTGSFAVIRVSLSHSGIDFKFTLKNGFWIQNLEDVNVRKEKLYTTKGLAFAELKARYINKINIVKRELEDLEEKYNNIKQYAKD